MSWYSQWLQCHCQSPQLGTGTTNTNSTLIRPWPSGSHLHWMRSNANEPGPLHRPPKDAPIWDHTQHEGHENCDWGCSRTRDRLDRPLELDKVRSKSRAHSRAHSKSRRRSKSHKHSKRRKRSKSWRRSKSRGHGGHEVCKPGVWSSQHENALKYAMEVLATIEWGTQHWKLQESFPVPYVPRWLRTPELMQTTMPLRGELPLIPFGTHLENIRIHSPATRVWIAILLQYWQDHMSRQLYRGCFQQASDLANTLIRDINPWLPHSVCFGWNYVAAHATLWLDM